MTPSIEELIKTKRVIVCCGAGGVGKTTTSAGLAVAAAQRGKKVLILTIDPSRRLAQVLGVDAHPPDPVPLSAEKLNELGVSAPGALHAWMLDPMRVAERTVRDAIGDSDDIDRFLTNPVFRQLSSMTAGMQEYSAMKALHDFVDGGEYELVVVDTPPAVHALDFLDAPSRLAELFDSRMLSVFRQKKGGALRRIGQSVMHRTLQAVTGETFADDFLFFMSQFEQVFSCLEADATAMRTYLETDKASFLLVTSPFERAVHEAFLFQDTAKRLSLPLAGYIFNRSCAQLRHREFPVAATFSESIPSTLLESLQELARAEQQAAAADLEVLRKVKARAGQEVFVLDLPLLENDNGDLARLAQVAGMLDGNGAESVE